MNEMNDQINQMLQKTLVYYFKLKEEGKNGLAKEVLGFGSSLADYCLTASGIRETYKPFSCPQCGRVVKTAGEQEWLKEYGFCFSCDDEWREANKNGTN